MKFLRTYSMLAEGQLGTISSGKPHQINFPLTCRFNVCNDNTFTLGNAVFQIYNLSKETRADLYKDPLEILKYKQVIFAAGYQQEPTSNVVIFQGNITQCYSYRQGADWITEIQATDGAWSTDNSHISLPLQSNYTFSYAIRKLVDAMSPTIQVGLIGSIEATPPVKNPRGISIFGSPYNLMVQQTTVKSLVAFIYKEKAYVMTQNEYRVIAGGVTEISNDTGMIGSPRLQAYQVIADMIFEPRIEVYQGIQLKTIENRMSGQYVVSRIIHRGTISGAVCEDLKTQVTLYRANLGQLVAAA